MNDNLTEQDSLQIISSMVNKARNQFSENGHLYLLWGWVILFCSLGQFVLQQVLQVRQFYLVWLLLIPTILYQFFYLWKEEKRSTVRTYTDEIIGYVWVAFMICSLLLIGVAGRYFSNRGYLTVIWLIMYGMPTFLSGAILRYRPLILGGVLCWVLAITSSFVPVQYHLLLLGAAVVCGWIIPGYGIQQKFKKQMDPNMTDQEQQLSEAESLALITEMIGKARNNFHESGVSAILWGSVVSFCGLVSFAQSFWKFYIGFDVWLLALVAIIPQIIISIRENRRKEVRTHLEAALDAIWIVYAISIFGIIFYINIVPAVSVQLLEKHEGVRLLQQHIVSGNTESFTPYALSASSLLLLVYAFPTMCTGLIQRFQPMIVGAVLCYLFFAASLFTITTYDNLFMGLAGIFNWLIPGIILRKRYLRAKHV